MEEWKNKGKGRVIWNLTLIAILPVFVAFSQRSTSDIPRCTPDSPFLDVAAKREYLNIFTIHELKPANYWTIYSIINKLIIMLWNPWNTVSRHDQKEKAFLNPISIHRPKKFTSSQLALREIIWPSRDNPIVTGFLI